MTDNVYKKLLTLRARVQGELSKDGHNAYVKFNYFKLDDILTVITPIMVELGLFDHTDFAWDVGRGVYVCRHPCLPFLLFSRILSDCDNSLIN